jgi:hypothetical protein
MNGFSTSFGRHSKSSDIIELNRVNGYCNPYRILYAVYLEDLNFLPCLACRIFFVLSKRGVKIWHVVIKPCLFFRMITLLRNIQGWHNYSLHLPPLKISQLFRLKSARHQNAAGDVAIYYTSHTIEIS